MIKIYKKVFLARLQRASVTCILISQRYKQKVGETLSHFNHYHSLRIPGVNGSAACLNTQTIAVVLIT